MDDNEELLNKISRQLSELGHVPGLDAMTCAGDQWSQSNLTQDGQQASYHNMYSWNPLDLPRPRQVTPPRSGEMHNNFRQGNRSTSGFDRFDPPQAPAWPESNKYGQQNFFVADGFPSHLTNDGQKKHGYEDNPVPPFLEMPSRSPFIGGDAVPRSGVNDSSVLDENLFGQTLEKQSLGTGFYPSDYHQRMPQTLKLQGSLISEDEAVARNVCSALSSAPPMFDPSTPPPLFSFPQNFSHPQHLSRHSSGDGEVFKLSQQAKSKVNLDLGTSIESPSRFASLDDIDLGDEEPLRFKPTSKQMEDKSTAQSSNEESLNEKPKPSYSDIAKSLKNSGSSVTESDVVCPADESVTIQESRLHNKDPFKLSRQTHMIKRTFSGTKFQPSKSSTTFKTYGLDDFDEPITQTATLSSSSESLSQAARSRRGSGSSAGSNTVSALDDIPLPTTARSSVSDTSLFWKSKGKGLDSQKRGKLSSSASVDGTVKYTSNPASKIPPTSNKEHVFFDPKRIFQSKGGLSGDTQSGSSTKAGKLAAEENLGKKSNTLLNNGKPATTTASTKLSSSAKQHDYINNDLRDASKLTNKTAEEFAVYSSAPSVPEKPQDVGHYKCDKDQRSSRRGGNNKTNGVTKKDKRKHVAEVERGRHHQSQTDNGPHHQQDRPSLLLENLYTGKIEEWLDVIREKSRVWGSIFKVWLLNFLIYSIGLVIFIATSVVHYLIIGINKLWSFIKTRLLKGAYKSDECGGSWSSDRERKRRRVGLEENIALPATGEEAMKRLLACRGKDPYSILGLRADSSDEEIKKYYRKQAVLVHPDKNQEPGAEEAFKVLGHAFEMIGEPGRRKQYDSHTQEELEADAMREFADMLTKLQTKIQEAANIMRCDTCGGKHRRVPVDRPFYSARFCQTCNIHHQAKEGDVWAESTMLGFYWHYYALMEKHVYDITEWMKCHKECFKHIKANSHNVMYRIATDGNRRRQHQPQNDGNLDELINRLLNKSGMAGGDGEHHRPPWTQPSNAFQSGSFHTGAGPGPSGSSSAAGGRRGGRKKRRK